MDIACFCFVLLLWFESFLFVESYLCVASLYLLHLLNQDFLGYANFREIQIPKHIVGLILEGETQTMTGGDL